MGKHVGIALVLVVLLFGMAWLWAGPGGEEVPGDAPAETGESAAPERRAAGGGQRRRRQP